jgi:hypothetical protein
MQQRTQILLLILFSLILTGADNPDYHPNAAKLNIKSLTDVRTTIALALGGLLKEGKEFSLSNLTEIDGVSTGTLSIFENTANITVKYTSASSIESMTAKFNSPANFKERDIKKISGERLGKILPDGLGDLPVNEIFIDFGNSTSMRSIALIIKSSPWQPVAGSTLTAENITFTVTTLNPIDRRPTVNASITAELKIAGFISQITGTGNTSNNWTIEGSATGITINNFINAISSSGIAGINIPTGVGSLGINLINYKIQPNQNLFTASGETSLGEIGAKYAGNKNAQAMLIAFSPPSGFKYSQLDPTLNFLDNMQFNNSVIAISTAQQSADLAVFNRVGSGKNLNRGLNIIAAYNISSLSPELSGLLVKSDLIIEATLSNKLVDTQFKTSINTDVKLDQKGNVMFRNIELSLQPSDLSVSMSGVIDVKTGGEWLKFRSGMTVDVKNVAFEVEGTMDGTWTNAFGYDGLNIKDLGLKVGASMKTIPVPLPELQLKGTLIAGNVNNPSFSGSVAVGISAYDPINSMIDANFTSITLGQIVGAFGSGVTVPNGVQGILNSSKVNNVQITVVPNPQGTTMFGKTYDPGFLVKGSANIVDFSADLMIAIGQAKMEARASIGAIDYSPVFALRGVNEPNPYFHLLLQPGSSSKFSISGSATLLGITSTTDMHISDSGFDLYLSGKIYDKFQADLEVHASSSKDQASFGVKATLQNDLFTALTEQASNEIDKATKSTQSDITNAQQTITTEQNKLNSLNGNITSMRATVQAERDRDCGRLRSAESAVEAERQKVQKVQGDIDAAHARIKAIDNRIYDKRKWVDAGGDPFSITARGAEASPFFIEQSAIRVKEMGEIATLESYKATANLALIASREVLKGMGDLCVSTPIDADPRIAALFTLKETSQGSMEAAKYILEGAKIVGVGTLQASNWIVQNGPMGVVKINFAQFEGTLNSVNGGKVSLHVKGTFADSPLDTKFSFNFDDPLSSAKVLADQLLK